MTRPTMTTAAPVEAPRFEGALTMHLPAPPEAVFPLLCPVREYDWIPHWSCELLHSASGAAEAGCVFRTAFPGIGGETWLCIRHEPPKAIEYVRFAELGVVTHLTITLAPDGAGGAAVLWSLARTATSDAGRAYLATLTKAGYEQETAALQAMLDHHLRSGTMLRAPRLG